MSPAEIIVAILGGLLVNEACDVSPWLARKLVRWSAVRRYGDTPRATIRADELVAVIAERPGKLLKLFTALGFAAAAMASSAARRAGVPIDRVLGLEHSLSLRLLRFELPTLVICADGIHASARRHWMAVVPTLAGCGAVSLSLTYLCGRAVAGGHTYAATGEGLLASVVVLAAVTRAITAWYYTALAFGEDEIALLWPGVGRTVRYDEIVSVRVRRGRLGRYFNFGTLEIAHGRKTRLRFVPAPYYFRGEIARMRLIAWQAGPPEPARTRAIAGADRLLPPLAPGLRFSRLRLWSMLSTALLLPLIPFIALVLLWDWLTPMWRRRKTGTERAEYRSSQYRSSRSRYRDYDDAFEDEETEAERPIRRG
jgi:hypothetical protein